MNLKCLKLPANLLSQEISDFKTLQLIFIVSAIYLSALRFTDLDLGRWVDTVLELLKLILLLNNPLIVENVP